MTKLVYINQRSEDEDFFGQLQTEMDSRYPNEFFIQDFDTVKMNLDSELFIRCLTASAACDFIVMDLHSGVTHFSGFREFFASAQGKKPIFIRTGMDDELEALMDKLGVPLDKYAILDGYIRAGGIENYAAQALYIANNWNGGTYEVPEPIFRKWQCLYEPSGSVEDEDAYMERVKSSDKTVVGVIVHSHHMRRNDMATADMLHDTLLRLGAQPLLVVNNIMPPLDDSLSLREAFKRYFTAEGKPVVHAIINTTGMSVTVLTSPGDGSAGRDESIFELSGVPVLQAMQTYYNREQWTVSLAGLDAMMLSCCVYQPEFDGQIITFPASSKEVVKTEFGERELFMPIPDRVEKMCRIAINWGKLRQKSEADKKIAIILHNMPPRNDMIGCAYQLDTPASVFNMVNALSAEGVKLDYQFEDGRGIIERIINGLTNDGRWLPQEAMLERSVDTLSTERYRTWFDNYGAEVQAKLTEDWGKPPGEFMTVDGKFLIPGILNGNVFIGLQPPRAHEEKAEAAYHSTDLVCPHQYLAFYRWVEHVFKADVIAHVGTHGTLEWLPGKEIGLSKDCYPDMAIGCLPHLYVYNISVMGEGMQAKRRSYAALIGHMTPSMTDSGVYGSLAEMDDLIDDYYHAKQNSKSQAAELRAQIWELAVKLNLHLDLEVSEQPAADDMDGFVKRLHLWVSRIKISEVRDGLHILGEVPQGERFTNLCKLLVRVQNGKVPSIRQALSERRGLDADDLLENGADIMPDGKTKMRVLEEIDEDGRGIFKKLSEFDFDTSRVAELAADGKLRDCLDYVCASIAPNLRRVTDELTNFIKGVRGDFISPGPSGSPSRGSAHILPTGRNFYSIDPGAIPSRTAWRVGQTLAKQMLERESSEAGQLPESVAIVVFAGDTMKTCGEDLAEALFLMGVKPVWLGNTDRVIGMDVIPPEELGRPRIDVTLRISGLFRDTFPNLIERIEDAVLLASALDEPHTQNYLRKHIDEEMEQMLADGIDREQAFERASARVFGCPSGTYGAGVDTLINSKKWNTKSDLGNVYIMWSGHAYGRKLHGENFQDQFRLRLSKTTVTIKNEADVELDILDNDDRYIYHGGLNAAIAAVSGRTPKAYTANTADINHAETFTLHEETSRIMRARINNPKWLAGLKPHGYKGAQEISSMMDYVFGFDATSDNIDDWMYQEITGNFVFNQDTRDWINDVNPWAARAIAERLLEANQRGMWNTDEDTLKRLKEIFLETEGLIEEGL